MSVHIGYYNSLYSTYLFIYILQTEHNLSSIIFPSILFHKFQNTNHIFYKHNKIYDTKSCKLINIIFYLHNN